MKSKVLDIYKYFIILFVITIYFISGIWTEYNKVYNFSSVDKVKEIARGA